MISFQHVKTIAKKELRSFFDNPTAYIILVVFLLFWEFLFFRNAFLVGESSLSGLFELLPWLMLILVPALTMGSVSQEKSDGTIELLLTHPVNEKEFILGKFFGSFIFVAITLLLVLPIAFSFQSFGSIDWGVVGGQYLAGLCLAAVLISLGLFLSSLFSNQIASLVAIVVASFFLLIIGFELVTASLPPEATPILEKISALSHFNSMARGVIDLRDVWYVISAALIFLLLTNVQLLRQKFGNNRALYRHTQLKTAVFVLVAILINVAGSYIPGRLDLTETKAYTLSDASKKILTELPKNVDITLYASSALPAQLQPVLRETKDVLRDYQTMGKGKVRVSTKNPTTDKKVSDEAATLGLREVQFNVIGQEEFQVKSGFLGIVISAGDVHEALPYLQSTSDLEYQLTSLVRKLTTAEKKKIGFLTGHGEKSSAGQYRALSEELKKQFDLQDVTIDEKNTSVPESLAALIIAGPTQKIDDKARTALTKYIDGGGSVLLLLDPVFIDPQTLTASANENSFSDFAKEYGVDISDGIVYDLESHETLNFGSQGMSYLLPYPLWIKSIVPAGLTSPITSSIKQVTFPWTSALTTNEEILKSQGFRVDKLLTTTDFGGRLSTTLKLTPDQTYPENNLSAQLLATALIKDGSEKLESGRLIIVGDSEFLEDQFVRSSPENFGFGISALSWLAQENSLASIRLKQAVERKLLFTDKTQPTLVKYGNLGVV
ncbi:MAG TPA: Gldg family protein, partial [Patescibacteria group bacterium]|nr:Gldg family protein [Patescibacteria group bacterium]